MSAPRMRTKKRADVVRLMVGTPKQFADRTAQRALTVDDVARLLGVSPGRVRLFVAKNQIRPVTTFGKSVVLTFSEVSRFAQGAGYEIALGVDDPEPRRRSARAAKVGGST